MEHGTQNGVRTNHDREPWVNGVNGGAVKREVSPDKSKMMGSMLNGGGGSMELESETAEPPPIPHINAEIIPLGLIVKRLAQFSHGKLQEIISTLASRPLPQQVANGAGGNYQYTGAEDPSPESRDKKAFLLNAMQELHQKWTKVLVITEWCKRAPQVGRLIDIKVHLQLQIGLFEDVFRALLAFKQRVNVAKVPSPDLKTALEVLSSGEASWIQDFNYIKPPPLTDAQTDEWLEEINTLLSVRLSYHDYDRLPPAFKDYTICDGRVTFRVEGEFEVDLTICDEDFEQQYWFIDFRYLFSPAPPETSPRVRAYLEDQANKVLYSDGLEGCYKFLHEFVLTAKITEFRRQGYLLAKARWVDALKVDWLQRSLSIQYWLNRTHSQPTKSFIILGVHSGDFDGVHGTKLPSRISLRWFRDGKEVPASHIPLDVNTISTEKLILTVIAHHIEHIFTTICNKLLSKPRFAQREAQLDMEISKDEPQNSSLTMQLFGDEKATLRVTPITGSFVMLPQIPILLEGQHKFNSSSNPGEEGPIALEHLRWVYTNRELQRRSKSIGWSIFKPQIQLEELKKIVYSNSPATREPFQSVWMRKLGWNPQWFVVVSMSLGGDQWFLVQLSYPNPGAQPGQSAPPRLKMFTKLPLTSGELTLSEEFFQNLAVYASGIISHITDLRELHLNRLGHTVREAVNVNYGLPSQIKMPTIYVRLSDLLRVRENGEQEPPKMTWAKDYIPISFQGIRSATDETVNEDGSIRVRRDGRVKVLAEARLDVHDSDKFRHLKRKVDDDVFYDRHRGQFILRLRTDMGTPFVNMLGDQIKALEHVVGFLNAIRTAGDHVKPETVTLREVSFTYPRGKSPLNHNNAQQHQVPTWLVRLDLTVEDGPKVHLERGNPHLRVLNYLESIAKSQSLYEGLPKLIPLTLPLYRGLDAMEDEWSAISLQHPGHSLQLFPREVGWVNVRFTYPGARRCLNIDIRYRQRRGEFVWMIYRSEGLDPLIPGAKRTGPNGTTESEFDRLLSEKLWSAKAPGIKGLGNSAAVDLQTGIEPFLSILSNAAKSYIGTPVPPAQMQMPPTMQMQNPAAAAGVMGGAPGGPPGPGPAGLQQHQQQQHQQPQQPPAHLQHQMQQQQQQQMSSVPGPAPRPNMMMNPQQQHQLQHQQMPPAPMPNLNNRFSQQHRQQQHQQQQQQAMMGGQMHGGQNNQQQQGGGNHNQGRGPVGTKNNAVVVLD